MVENLLVKHLGGSHAYGTAIETSDVDYRGIFCADPVNYLTPFFTIKECEDTTEEDTKMYELGHFTKLCVDCNPNIVETLWVDDVDISFRTPAYDYLRSQRSEFLSSKIAFTTSGYALAQLKRIRGHNKWINNPQPEEPPKPYQFLQVVQWFGKEKNLHPNLTEYHDDHRLIPYGNDLYGVVSWPGYELWNKLGHVMDKFEESRADLPPTLMVVKWNKDEYRTAKERHEQYWLWKKNRNAARGTLEEQFGYDTKHAMHLVRLLRMGKEALQEGKLIVKRPDAAELLSIRNGAWTYEEVVSYAESMDKEVREVLYKNTSLPKYANVHRVAEILMETQNLVWKKDDKRTD